MLGKLPCLIAFALIALGGEAAAGGVGLDRSLSLDQILANCNPATGLPRGVKLPPMPGPRRSVIINPDWLKRPDAKAYAAAYPAAAKAAHIAGRADVQCVVGSDGRPHDCLVIDDTPGGMGFGDAALKLASSTLFIPKRFDCAPVDGGQVSIPMSFSPR